MNLYLRIKEYLQTVFRSIRGLGMMEMDATPIGRACPTAVNLLKIKRCPIFAGPWPNSFSFCTVYAMKRSIGPQTFEKCPKSSKKSSFRQCFDLLSQNHQLRTITNLGHLTLEERKFQDFQESDSCPTCCLCYCVAHCSRWEKVDLASVGDFRAPNFEQKPLKNGYIGYRARLADDIYVTRRT